jgi:hypothetical protein
MLVGITCTSYKERKFDKRINKFTETWKLDINGFKNLKLFVSKIPIRNTNHLEKLKKILNMGPGPIS